MTKLVWHIDRAIFEFSDAEEYREWSENPIVRFEWTPSGADEPGEDLFVDPFDIEIDMAVTDVNGKLKISEGESGPVISAWIEVDVETTDDFSVESLEEWANEQGGWASASIYLDDADAFITEDDGGDWRVAE